MTDNTPKLPTEFELDILSVLWRRGPSTVREVLEALSGEVRRGYTTVLKTMQIMHEKELVLRDESSRTHLYAARRPPGATQRGLVADLLDRAFDGSTSHLVQSALDARPSTVDELREIRRLIDEAEQEAK